LGGALVLSIAASAELLPVPGNRASLLQNLVFFLAGLYFRPYVERLATGAGLVRLALATGAYGAALDRKSTRLNSSHVKISYAVRPDRHSFPTRRSSDLAGRCPGAVHRGLRRAAARTRQPGLPPPEPGLLPRRPVLPPVRRAPGHGRGPGAPGPGDRRVRRGP